MLAALPRRCPNHRDNTHTVMRSLTDREKKTLRLGVIALASYLVVFGGLKLWKLCERKRADYRELVSEAQKFRRQIQVYEDKAEAARKLMENFKLDPATLSATTTVARASAAIQRAAAGGGMQVGPVRESPGRPASKELATLQLEVTGPVPAATSLLGRLESVGFPLLIDAVQFSSEPTRPGQVKVSLTIVILDFEQWKKEGAPNA